VAITRSRVVIVSDRVYRGLLAAYPPEFRQRYAPEMAQVFRTCCRSSYDSSGVSGVLRLWLPTLWDWARSMASERCSSLFRRTEMYKIHPRRSSSQLIALLFFLTACLSLLFVNPCTWVFGDPLFIEYCGLDIDNQSGKTLRVTPINPDNPLSPVRIYRKTDPRIPAYQQANIIVKSGDQVYLPYSCKHQSISELYACDLDGGCYLHQHAIHVYPLSVRFTFKSLDSLSRPETALEAALGSFPEHNYSTLKYVLLCVIQLAAVIGGVYWLVRTRTVDISKGEI
jgi:hypothetical protein